MRLDKLGIWETNMGLKRKGMRSLRLKSVFFAPTLPFVLSFLSQQNEGLFWGAECE